MVIFIKSLSVFMNVSKKPKYPFKLFSVLLLVNRQKSMLTKNDDKTSLLFTFACKMPTSHLIISAIIQNQFYWP